MRRMIALAALALLGACDAPLIVDCGDMGTFAEAGGDHWCIFTRRGVVSCPDLLPVDHDLPWGGYGCASREHDSIPPDLCMAVDECADGGM